MFKKQNLDLKGHDTPQSSTNEFTKECLDQMGEISMLLKEDGFIVSMAPPEVSTTGCQRCHVNPSFLRIL